MESSTEDYSRKTRKWKENIANLLFRKNVCGICLKMDCVLKKWDNICFVEVGGVERNLKNIMECTFLDNITSLLPTTSFCEECTSSILSTYTMVKKIRSNHDILQKYFSVINEQIDVGVQTELPTEKQLMLTIDNVESLNVPTMVTEECKKAEKITQIFLCEVDNLDFEPEVYNTNKNTPKYECPYCGKNSKDYKLFKEHYKQHNEKFFRCYRCSKRFRNFDELISHRKNTHSDKLSACDLCKIILLSASSTEHMSEHLSTFMCYVCQITFDAKACLEEHIKKHHCEVICHYCHKNFSNALNLEHHKCLFKCQECKEKCIHKDYLTSFREQHLANQTEFKCRDCDFKYSMRSQLICHVNEEHLHHFPYLCHICGESFASKPFLTNHNYKKHADILQDKNIGPIASSVLIEDPFECKTCGECFATEESYEKHSKKHLKGITLRTDSRNHYTKEKNSRKLGVKYPVYQCSMCTLDFLTEIEFAKHKSTHPTGTKHVCRACNKTFLHAKLYNSHLRKHTIQYDKQCPICFKKYTKYTLHRHMKRHQGEKLKDITCEVCRASFINENALVKHAVKHTEVKKCPVCLVNVNSAFFTKHVNTHKQPEKCLKHCSYCNYKTKFHTCLEAHINRHHLKKRPYQCEVCDKTFYSQYTLRSHKITHSQVRSEHYCHICGSKFISKKAVMLHTRLHTGETPYPCEFCDLSFISSSRRRQHVIRRHFEPSIECSICNKKLYTQSDLRRHMGDCHDGENKRKKSKKDEAVVDLENEQEIEQEIINVPT